MNRTYVDVHVLQTVPPSNLNRDDAGSPKQAVYGGVRRARVSSQAWKRATRRAFRESGIAGDLPLGTRTRRLRHLLEERWASRGVKAETAQAWSASVLEKSKITMDKKNKDATSYLLFLAYRQVDELAEHVASVLGEDPSAALDQARIHELLGRGHSLDVALFGRMVADVAELNVDAAAQVAHALSTHGVDVEFDYFTAVEDESEREETGAGMIGTVEFTSATLYRYATVAVHALRDNLAGSDDETVVRAVEAFVRGFVRSMPSGKQSTFAHQTLPDAVCLVVRDDQPVNLVSAFEDPVVGPGLADASLRRLDAELELSTRLWGGRPRAVASTYAAPPDGSALLALGGSVPFDEAVATALEAVRAQPSARA